MRNTKWLLWSFTILALDQLTKLLALHYLELYQPVEVLPFFSLTLAFNTGAAFSFLSQAGGWQQVLFALVAIGVSVMLLSWLYQLQRDDKLSALAITSILGGAFGNLIDRLNRGYVVDFFDFYWYSYHWPIFNVADIAISMGAALYIWILIFKKQGENHV